MTGLSDNQSDRSVNHLHLQCEDCHKNIYTFSIIAYRNSGRSRLVGFKEFDRDLFFQWLCALICQRLNQTGALNFCYKGKEAAELKLNCPKEFRFIGVRSF